MSDAEQLAREALRFDPLAYLEKNGVSYKDDENLGLTLGFFGIANKVKEERLKALGDTHWSITWSDFLNLLEMEGWVIIRRERGRYKPDSEAETRPEFIVAAHPKRLILTAGSWLWATLDVPEKINSGYVFGCVPTPRTSTDEEPFNEEEKAIVRRNMNALIGASNGGWNPRYFDKDIREGLFLWLNDVEDAVGEFSVWDEEARNHLRFDDYTKREESDYKDPHWIDNYLAKQKADLDAFLAIAPDWVKEFMGCSQ